MSRCFPFPPPGHERKHRLEDLDVLKEVKHKEKKQRKEKTDKDKERKKDREKKEKHGSGEKQKDKKDRKSKHKDKKEKHRDKKKDKEDQGKDKERSSISEESTVARKLEEKTGEKLEPKGQIKVRSSDGDDGKYTNIFHGQNGGIRDDEKDRRTQVAERVASVDKKDKEAAARIAFQNPLRVLEEEKSSNAGNRVDVRKMETRGLENEFTGMAMVRDLTLVAKSKVEGTPRPVEEKNNWRLEDKAKYKETGQNKQGNEHKDRNKKSHRKDKDNEKEKKKKEKEKVKIENKKSEHDKSEIAGRNDLVIATSNESTNLLKDVDCTAPNEGNIWKRKHLDSNGFLHESEIRPYKIPRPALHQSTENGRKLEGSKIPSKSSLDNGIIEAQKPSPSKPNPFTTAMDSDISNEALTMPTVEDHIAEASRRPPHPESEYLSKVLTVPKIGDWSENDDEEWFFSKKGPPNKPELELAGFKEDICVWSEGVNIESAEVYALPYVIPY